MPPFDRTGRNFKLWLFKGGRQSADADDRPGSHKQHPWWKVTPAVPNAIAAFLLFLRNETGKLPHVYFAWSEGNPLSYLLKHIAFGEGGYGSRHA